MHAQRKAHAIATDGISFFTEGISVWKFAGVARVRNVIFEGF
jgi:hypothetical protein